MAGSAETISNAEKIRLPPNRSANIPAGTLPNAPSNTGTAIIRLLALADRPYVCAKVGASAPINPHTANETAKDVVERKSARVAPGWNFIALDIRFKVSYVPTPDVYSATTIPHEIVGIFES